MKYAIIAGGEGSRLAAEGVAEAKPLVSVCGEMLIDRLLRIFADNGAESVVVAYRKGMDSVAVHLEELCRDGICGKYLPIEAVETCTPSSMHSLLAISDRLEYSPFCLTTVDTVFNENMFSRYVNILQNAMSNGTADGIMAVTSYIDDEKPLYVAVDDDMNITAFSDTDNGCRYVSAGIYGLSPHSICVLRDCAARGESRMRNFQRALLRNGIRLKAFDIGKAFDIDHTKDIVKAEQILCDRQ